MCQNVKRFVKVYGCRTKYHITNIHVTKVTNIFPPPTHNVMSLSPFTGLRMSLDASINKLQNTPSLFMAVCRHLKTASVSSMLIPSVTQIVPLHDNHPNISLHLPWISGDLHYISISLCETTGEMLTLLV